MQPREHEAKSVRSAPQSVRKLAKSLSEWTTARHRKNAQTTVTFHAEDIPASINAGMKTADRFVTRVGRLLVKRPRSHRGHPYWGGAIASFKEATGRRLTQREWRLALGLPNPELDSNWVSAKLVELLRFLVFGMPPNVRSWHPRAKDNKLVLRFVNKCLASSDSKLLLIGDNPTVITSALPDGGERVLRIQKSVFLKQAPEFYDPLSETFNACLMELSEAELAQGDQLVDRIAPLIAPGGKIIVSVLNKRSVADGRDFVRSIGFHASRFVRPSAKTIRYHFVSPRDTQWRAYHTMLKLSRLVQRRQAIGIPAFLVAGAPIAIAGWAASWATKVVRGKPPKGIASSIVLEIEVDAEAAVKAYDYSATRVLRERSRKMLGAVGPDRFSLESEFQPIRDVRQILGDSTVAKPSIAVQKGTIVAERPGVPMRQPEGAPKAPEHDVMPHVGTKEPQYNRCLTLREEFGLTSLGLMTNQVWHDDPRRLTFLLARYKFVSKMLSGKKLVGELGCGDAFGTRVVMQEVEKLIAYDFDPLFVEDIQQRQSKRWPVEAYYHDIIEKPLPNLHDGIYSLDVIEHINIHEEHAYLTNLCASLTDDGVLIVGTPSLESQAYASPPSKEGHVNCKTGPELKAILNQYFQNVFIFSMNDEVVHTGFTPMAHYLFALCCQRKAKI